MKTERIKALLAVLLITALCFSLVGCGKDSTEEISTTDSIETDVVELLSTALKRSWLKRSSSGIMMYFTSFLTKE